MPLHATQMSFAGGEVSPLIVHRFGDDQYALGARTLENFIVSESGALTRRPGTHHADNGSTKGNVPAYLLTWIYNDQDAYVLEFTPLCIRVYRDHGLVESELGMPLEIVTPFTAAELPSLQTWQSGDVLWIRSQSRWNYKLTRSSHTSWALTASYPIDGPWRGTNTESITLAASNIGKPGSYTIITASGGNVFQPGHVNSAWRLDHTLPERSQDKTFESVETDTQSLLISRGGEWEFSVQASGGAAIDADIELQYSLDGTTWKRYRSVSVVRAASDASFLDKLSDLFRGKLSLGTKDTVSAAHSAENDEIKAIYLRAACTRYSSGSIKTSILAKPFTHRGVVWLTMYTSPTQMGGFIHVSPANTDPTDSWAESCANGVRGYWRALGFSQERILLAGTEDEPLRIDAGVAGYYDSFDPGFADDTDAFNVTLSQSRQNRINWIIGEWSSSFIVGTEGGMVEMRPYSGSQAFSPTNWPSIYRTLRRRTGRILPTMIDDVLVVPGGVNNQRLYQIYDSNERGGLVAEDLTRWARHIGASGFVGMFAQQDPDQILYLPRTDGVLAGCTFSYGATAWHRHTIGDAVVSGCTKPTSDGDEVWLCVQRTVNGVPMYFVEYINPIDTEIDIERAHYLDCAELWSGGDPVNVVSVSRTDPTLIQLEAWPSDSDGNALKNGDTVRFNGIADMAMQIFQVSEANPAARSLQLLDVTGATTIDGSLFTGTVQGGTLEWVRRELAGMGHMANQTLTALVDGREQAIGVDATGSFSLGDAADPMNYARNILAGIAYTSLFTSLPCEFYLSSGATTGRHKRLGKLTLSLYNSFGGEYGVSSSRFDPITYPRHADQVEAGPFLYTGQKDLPAVGGVFSGELNVSIRCIGPYPFTIRGIAPTLEVHE
jgi:hypothetical protein